MKLIHVNVKEADREEYTSHGFFVDHSDVDFVGRGSSEQEAEEKMIEKAKAWLKEYTRKPN